MYTIQNPINSAISGMGQASNSLASMTKDVGYKQPGHTAGGAIMNGLGGAGTMAAIGATESGAAALGSLGLGGPIGLGVGALLGIGSYLFS